MLPLELLLHGEEDIEDDIDDIGEGIITDDDPVVEEETESWPWTKEAAGTVVEAVSILEAVELAAILSNLELAMLITLGGRWL